MGLGEGSLEAFVVVESRARHDEEQILTAGGLGLQVVLTTLPKWVSGHRCAHSATGVPRRERDDRVS